jgi:hypothetical protein
MKALRSTFAALLAAAVASAVWAQMNRQTKLVVTEPTEIPGKVLDPGTYVIKVIDTKNEKEIVQFTNEDQTTVVATVLAVRDYRVTTKENSEFTYFQRGEGLPIALRTWFYPGDNWGESFVYPKVQAAEITKATRESVLTTTAEPPVLSSEVERMTGEEKMTPYRGGTPEKALPATSSVLPLVALLGAASLAGAVALRLARS